MNLSVLWMFHVLGYRGKWATSSGGNEGSRNASRKLQGTKMHIISTNTWQFQVRFVAIQNIRILWSLKFKYIQPPCKYPLWFKLYLSSEKTTRDRTRLGVTHQCGEEARLHASGQMVFTLKVGSVWPTINPVCSIRWREEAVSMLEVNKQDPGRAAAALCMTTMKDLAKMVHLPLIGQVLRIKI